MRGEKNVPLPNPLRGTRVLPTDKGNLLYQKREKGGKKGQ